MLLWTWCYAVLILNVSHIDELIQAAPRLYIPQTSTDQGVEFSFAKLRKHRVLSICW